MTIHSPHPDSHVYGLADDCPRCEEHAIDPVSGLDSENLTRIIRMAVGEEEPLTYHDAVARVSILNMLERVGHCYRTAPDEIEAFLMRYLPRRIGA